MDPTIAWAYASTTSSCYYFFLLFIQVEGSPQIMSDPERLQIKTYLLDLMLSVPLKPQKQLAEALWHISKYDFPAKWPNLVDVRKNKPAHIETTTTTTTTTTTIHDDP